MHTYVRRNILPRYIYVHRWWLLRQLHRQHHHGASRAEGCYTDQWAFRGSRLRLDGHCTFHFLTAARKAIISFYRSHPYSPAYRFLIGCGAGIGLCTGPIFLAEIAPSKIRGSVGRFLVFIKTAHLMNGIRCSHPACCSIGHHDHSTPWLAYGNANFMEICVIISLRCLGRAVMSEPVHYRDSNMVEAEWQVRRLPYCAEGSLPGAR